MSKPLIFASGNGGDLNAEWRARFGKDTGAGPVTIANIGGNKSAFVRQRLAADRAMGRISVVWMEMSGIQMQQPGFNPSQLVNHTDTLAYTAALVEHCQLGGLAVVTLMDEIEQHAPWGADMYKDTYNKIASRFPVGVFAAWEKAPFVGSKKYGGPLKFADWRPSLAVLRGYHAHGDNVFPDTEKGADTARFLDETRSLGFAGTVVMDGGFTGATPPAGSPYTTPFIGDVRDPAASVPWLKAHLKMLEDHEVVLSVAPHNTPNWSVPPWQSGRYVPGAHSPPGDKASPPWDGCPEFCDILAKYMELPRVLSHGSPILAAGIEGLTTALGLPLGMGAQA